MVIVSGDGLKAWRLARGMTLSAAATYFGLGGANPAETYRRYEAGLVWPSAEMIDRISRLTGGEVTAESMVAMRLHSRASSVTDVPEEEAA